MRAVAADIASLPALLRARVRGTFELTSAEDATRHAGPPPFRQSLMLVGAGCLATLVLVIVHSVRTAAVLPPATSRFRSINAIALATTNMETSYAFYDALGLDCTYGCGGGPSNWTTFGGKDGELHTFHINLYPALPPSQPLPGWWGRVIFYVVSVDAVYELALRNGLTPEFSPRDADWGERYFQILDPSGHELSIAAPLPRT
uniref:VOC domain-containing protein n=1 Tax=Coccolithus braarudii TaxID=221442 RepID=A0A7S0LK42_9EUKA|mmetsp:Transcript_41563/g.88694  ORF Transcript_41563/g.88694 Transcript_41563/m.88694 type:complete len:203 (+) Transcript_41563:93-701(+)